MNWLNTISLILGVAALLLALLFLVFALSGKATDKPLPQNGKVYHEAYASTASVALYAAAVLTQSCYQWSLIQNADWATLIDHSTYMVLLAALLPVILVVNLVMLVLYQRKRSSMTGS